MVGVAVLITGALLGWGDGGGGETAGAPPNSTATSVTSAVSPSPTSVVTLTLTPRTPPAVVPTVAAPSPDARGTTVARTITLDASTIASPFHPWDGVSTVLYDVAAGRETDLGPGSVGAFSPNGRWFAWLPGRADPTLDGRLPLGDAVAMDLRTGQRISLGRTSAVDFIGPDTVALRTDGASPAAPPTISTLNLVTGERTVLDPSDLDVIYNAAQAPTTLDGLGVYPVITADWFAAGTHYDQPLPYEVRDASGAIYLRLEAPFVTAGGPGEIIAGYRSVEGSATFFTYYAVDVATGRMTYLARAQGNQSIAASDRWVAVTEGICLAQHSVVLIDRHSGEATRIVFPANEPASNVAFSAAGELVVGNLVALSAVIDPANPRYLARIPDQAASTPSGGGAITWSPDHRYASRGSAVGPTDSC
jgi:hypothetical protein